MKTLSAFSLQLPPQTIEIHSQFKNQKKKVFHEGKSCIKNAQKGSTQKSPFFVKGPFGVGIHFHRV